MSRQFHNHGHPKQVHGEGQHNHGHAKYVHDNDHNHGHTEHLEGHTKQSIIDTVPHIGGLSVERLEEAFNSNGLLDQVVAKEAFSAMKEGTEFSFVLARGRRMEFIIYPMLEDVSMWTRLFRQSFPIKE